MQKRTNVDFSKHELTIRKDKYTTIHDLKIPGSVLHRVQFINTCGNLIVNGDYRNWIFCRQFLPSEEGSVSDSYWIEKLRIASCQEPASYSAEVTKARLQEAIDNYQYEGNEEMVNYYTDCLGMAETDEWTYVSYAYDNLPSGCDAESLIVGKELSYALLVVFDAFEEACLRIRNGNFKEE